MPPETHIRYRAQRLIRMGEWLERNMDALITFYDKVDDEHTQALDCEKDIELLMCHVIAMTHALNAQGRLMMELRRNEWNVERGGDVTMVNPFACEEHRETVLIKAPTAKVNLPVVPPNPSHN